MDEERKCCEKGFNWTVMVLCALVVLVLLIGY